MKKISIIFLAFISALVLYGCGNKETAQEPVTEPEVTIDENAYVNKTWDFSVIIPEGYKISDRNGFVIYKEVSDETSEPIPEIMIVTKESDDIEVREEAVVSSEDVEVNGISGKKFLLQYELEDGTDAECSIYKFLENGVTYEFSLWECMENPVFEEIVMSFNVI